LQILEDPDRVFLLPKAILNKQANETRSYEQFFARAEFAADLTAIFNRGEKEAERSGVGSMDSLHIAASHLLKADAFITTERPTKSIHRSLLVRVVCLFN